jgi:hypothetical protein
VRRKVVIAFDDDCVVAFGNYLIIPDCFHV